MASDPDQEPSKKWPLLFAAAEEEQERRHHHLQQNSTEEETVDEDDDDISYDEYDSDDDDDDEASSSSSFSSSSLLIGNMMREHSLAIMVAIMATIVAHRSITTTQQQHQPTTPTAQKMLLWEKHAHLDRYQRTGNISFCDDSSDNNSAAVVGASSFPDATSSASSFRHQFQMMDFQIPTSLLDTLKLHYVADAIQDHDYVKVLEMDGAALGSHNNNDNDKIRNEMDCIDRRQQAATTKKDYITGTTYYYDPPTFADMMYSADPASDNDNNHKKQNGGVVAMLAKATKAAGAAADQKNKKQQQQQQPAHLTFTGFASKFVNLSPRAVLLYWDGRRGGADRRLVGEIGPFESLGTATTPGQSFSVTPPHDSSHALRRWTVTADDPVLYYEEDTNNKQEVTTRQHHMYNMQLLNRAFAKHYLIHARRPWLANFPRAFPVHRMWDASYMGQEHRVTLTSATTTLDDDDDGSTGDHNNQHQQRSPEPEPERNLTLQVRSVTPRVLTIPNFLSKTECQELIQMALDYGMEGSTLYAGGSRGRVGAAAKQQRDLSTRSSTNTWFARDSSQLTDQLYRRAAEVLQIPVDMLQSNRIADEIDDPHYHSMSESLQVIRYKKGEEYTAHHDFVYPSITSRYQPTRFATLLMYLNDDYEGGATQFPRAVNAQHHDGVTISKEPDAGTAVLFYNMLPDGNVDDLSQHRSLPVTRGEKFAANLWIWDPLIN